VSKLSRIQMLRAVNLNDTTNLLTFEKTTRTYKKRASGSSREAGSTLKIKVMNDLNVYLSALSGRNFSNYLKLSKSFLFVEFA
jgi:hypothetical protein